MHLLLLLIVVIAGCGLSAEPRQAEIPTPNVIVIMTDDQGWGDFGFHGNPVLQTPSLDRLGAESTRLNTFYVHPVCTPTRSALMTGRYPQRTRAFDTWIGRAMLEPEEVTVAEVLRDAGWATGIFGKWHLGDCYPMRAMDQGFDESLVHLGGGIGQPSDPEGGEGNYTNPILFHNGEREQTQGYCTDVYFDQALGWIQEQSGSDKPFFAYIPTNAPHGPFHDVPEELLKKYQTMDLSQAFVPPTEGHPLPTGFDADKLARIYAMIENVDQNVAKLMQGLEDLGIADNTMVIFLVDNGPNTRRHVGGRRGMKASVYEGGVRSPLWVRWPAELQPGEGADRVAAHIDLMPTILDACGVKSAALANVDGRSLLPLLKGNDQQWQDRPLVIQAHRGDEGVRYHNFLLRTEQWKLVNASGFGREVQSVEPEFELYDMQADPLEMKNVAAKYPQIVDSLRAEYDDWFTNVSTTRADNWAPPSITVGSPRAHQVTLTRQDWRKLTGAGWSKDSQGEWNIEVAHPGPYGLRIRTIGVTDLSAVTVWCGDTESASASATGFNKDNEVWLEEVYLPLGKSKLRVDLESTNKIVGPYQIELRLNAIQR
jgi:arylsulfatase A-like enzyme